jgi:prepilin-type processing-associated H-X9-DG protein
MAATGFGSERLRGDGDQARWDRERDYWFADRRATTVDDAVLNCANTPEGDPPHYSRSGSSWLLFGYDQSFYNHIISPNAATPDCSENNIREKIDGGEDGGIHTARSHHSGGVNLVTADGSVRFIKATIATAVWRALGTRAGGEIFDSGF